MCGQRGLLADSDEQVYEVAVSRAFRERYNAILQPILAEVGYLKCVCARVCVWLLWCWSVPTNPS